MWLVFAVSNSYRTQVHAALCLQLSGQRCKLVSKRPPYTGGECVGSRLLCRVADYSTTSASRLNAKFHRPACVECLRHNSTTSPPVWRDMEKDVQ